MKILFDEFDHLLSYKMKIFDIIRETYSNNKYKDIINNLLEQKIIVNCEKILLNEFGDGTNIDREENWEMWAGLKHYFCHPYKIYLYDDNNENFLSFEWEEDIFSITKEKLIEILKNSGRKYLKVKINMGLFMWNQEMLEVEI